MRWWDVLELWFDFSCPCTQRADAPAIKDGLRQRTGEAIPLGIFGAPTWIRHGIGDPVYLDLKMQRWASWWGERFELPRKSPQRTAGWAAS